jgi:sugar lactone lactonase YvrE
VIGALATTQSFNRLHGIAFDGNGGGYFASPGQNRIYYVGNDGRIQRIIGSSSYGFGGDDGPANIALLKAPLGVAIDHANNVYIADSDNNRIRKVYPNGIITTIAGNGENGVSGDGGPATAAKLNGPRDIAIDFADNLYFPDPENHCVRKITAGVITTIAGNCHKSNLDESFQSNADYGDGGSATSARLGDPVGVTIDSSGNLFIADYRDCLIRKVTNGGIITTVAGNGTCGSSGDDGPATSAQLNHPTSVAVDSTGNLYILNSSDSTIRKVTPAGLITTIVGNGNSSFSSGVNNGTASEPNPTGIAVDLIGNLYIADFKGCVRKITVDGAMTIVAGDKSSGFSGDGGIATSARLDNPLRVVVDSTGNLFIADNGNRRIRKVTPDGVITTISGTGTSGLVGEGTAAISAQIGAPEQLVVDPKGNIYFYDRHFRKITPAGVITAAFKNESEIMKKLHYIVEMTVDSEGNIFILDSGTYHISKITPSGKITIVAGTGESGYAGDGGPAISAKLHDPESIALDRAGNLFILDGNCIRKVTPEGKITTVVRNLKVVNERIKSSARVIISGVFITSPMLSCLAVDSENNFYFFDGGRVNKVSSGGSKTTVAGVGKDGFGGDGGPTNLAVLSHPCGISVDSLGNLYIADSGNNRVRKVSMVSR